MLTTEEVHARQEAIRTALAEAEHEYQSARTQDYIALVIRDGLIVNAIRAGLSQKEIGGLVSDMNQPHVARANRRAVARRDVVPGGMVPADDAQQQSGLGPAAFMDAVRSGRIEAKPTGTPGVCAFLPEDVRALSDR
ncbi:hypothetical protein C1S82_31510 [Mycolicibacterium cosmeticum]|uniref:Uncharacterized protein n=1 Tax=Mycolicibacterium cosmeticum TaxID=258533 RepID=W9BIY4_MYCCO|nr:hypothetical protein [Mycolicibacterium cosmeticum]TLH64558.1 hypothetical protein C1S82_31510 [Mycolicibacterium cosmeticum]CDO06790.1 hypothetical protein BN977_01583 [Mycolicibacterium cosmeticum]